MSRELWFKKTVSTVSNLSGLLTEGDDLDPTDALVAVAPCANDVQRDLLNVAEVAGLELGGGDEGEGEVAQALVVLAQDHEHGGLSQDAMDRPGVAALEQPLLVLQDEVVQLLVAGHHRGGAEQVGLEHTTIPANQTHNKQCPRVMIMHLE
jgi:hypothetical protein